MYNSAYNQHHSYYPGKSPAPPPASQYTQSSQLNGQSNGQHNAQTPQLWMGDLDQRWDETTIKQIWSSVLAPLGILVHSVKLIRDKQSMNLELANAGYCFIRFHNFEDCYKVLELFNGKPIPGTNNVRFFRLNWSSANSSGANITAFQPKGQSEYSIFVGDLPQTVTEQTLLQAFQARYPSCSGAKVMVDPATGHLKGYGFVKFLNETDQKRALIEMQGYVLLGRPIRVSTASKSQTNAAANSSFASAMPSQDGPGQLKVNVPSLPQSAPLQYYNDPNNTTVFIGGLNVPISEMQLRTLFSRYGDISYVKIPPGKNCGFVQFFHRASAEMAISEMQGYDIGGGCRIRVSWGARAAQRNWFAKQLAMQQQPPQQAVQPLQTQQFQQANLYNMSNTLGLTGTQYSLLNDLLIDNAGTSATNGGSYSGSLLNIDRLSREPIPFSPLNSSGTSLTNSFASDELRMNEYFLASRLNNLEQLDIGSGLFKLN
ncbi:hypothetical protein KL928_003114 [Ogataea angusta]|uniref:RRM domain-containing protein n=1 Tax=Pichia angusta TaxID=870730 RepID=A0AAN6DEK1_PICAN|nr:uncharacterized protein KL928_003114 [Ogataea angusta]KAG7818113.1 hypothetical protein KL928_003114 [Ogataea angusta]KAG7834179.1 hypothetical protein KL943_003475 [Ogataea angusta]